MRFIVRPRFWNVEHSTFLGFVAKPRIFREIFRSYVQQLKIRLARVENTEKPSLVHLKQFEATYVRALVLTNFLRCK